MIEFYHCDGNGKTTAAIGAAVRAAGHSVPVVFCQFLKDGLSGEISTLEKIPGVFVLLPEHCLKAKIGKARRPTQVSHSCAGRSVAQR